MLISLSSHSEIYIELIWWFLMSKLSQIKVDCYYNCNKLSLSLIVAFNVKKVKQEKIIIVRYNKLRCRYQFFQS